jgi:hypothetical protein
VFLPPIADGALTLRVPHFEVTALLEKENSECPWERAITDSISSGMAPTQLTFLLVFSLSGDTWQMQISSDGL